METKDSKYEDDDFEEGELSDSDEGYIPLQRPEKKPADYQQASDPMKMEEAVEDSPFEFEQSSYSSSESEDEPKTSVRLISQREGRKKKRRPSKIKSVHANIDNKQSKFKKYNIWSASLQEESLTEDMRGIDVAKYPKSDRSVESYDFSLKYRLKDNNSLKRSLFTSGDECSVDNYCQDSKRAKTSSSRDRKFVKFKVGHKESRSSCDSQDAPRYIFDLTVTLENDYKEIARDIADKLYEENNELVERVLEVLGKNLPIETFKETQKIERDGGMMTLNRNRRRTPGGVFLFLIKRHNEISDEDKKRIFYETAREQGKDRKLLKTVRRDQKVEELKKKLNLKEKELPPPPNMEKYALGSRNTGALSNPPPSPVTNGGQDNSPDYSVHAINHVSDTSPEKLTPSELNNLNEDNLTACDEDFLDINNDYMDLF